MDLVNVLNTIRDNASQEYQERIPEATRTNISTIQEQMVDPSNANVANEFMATLLNMIVKQVIHSKLFKDPLQGLKKGNKPIGDTVEEIYTNFLKAKQYDPTGAELLKRELPDTKTLYHKMNRKDRYKVTVSPEMLSKAFSSYEKLGTYISSVVNTLYNSSELDEFILMKNLIKQACDNNALKVINVADPVLGDANGKAFIKTVKTISGDMQFPNSNNNSWLEAQSTDSNPLITFSKKSEQILILDNATDVALSVDVLASIFNMSVAEFNDTRKIVIDAFPDPSIRGALVDEQFFQVYDDLIMFKEFENPEGLYKNYWLHIWQTLSYSILVNGVVFKVAADSDDDGEVEEFTITKTLKTGVTSTNKRGKVAEGSSYSTTLRGVGDNDTVTVTMGSTTVEEVETPTDITDDVYDSETNKIFIPVVTDDITITVA